MSNNSKTAKARPKPTEIPLFGLIMSGKSKEKKSDSDEKRPKVKEKTNKTDEEKREGNSSVISKDKNSCNNDKKSKATVNTNQLNDGENVGNINEDTNSELKIGAVFSLPAESYLHDLGTKGTPKSVEEILYGIGKTAYLSQVKCKSCSVVLTDIDDILRGRSKVFYKTLDRQLKTQHSRCRKRNCLFSKTHPNKKMKINDNASSVEANNLSSDGRIRDSPPTSESSQSDSRHTVNSGTKYKFHNIFTNGAGKMFKFAPAMTAYTEKNDSWISQKISNLTEVCRDKMNDGLKSDKTRTTNVLTGNLLCSFENKKNESDSVKRPSQASTAILERLSNNLNVGISNNLNVGISNNLNVGNIPSVVETMIRPSVHTTTPATVSSAGNNLTIDQVPLPDINTKQTEKTLLHDTSDNSTKKSDAQEITVQDEYENQFLMINVDKNKILVPLKINEKNPKIYVVNDQSGTIVEKMAKKVTVSFDPSKIPKANKKSKPIDVTTTTNISPRSIGMSCPLSGGRNTAVSPSAQQQSGKNVSQNVQQNPSAVQKQQFKQTQKQHSQKQQSAQIVVQQQAQQKQQQTPILVQQQQHAQQHQQTPVLVQKQQQAQQQQQTPVLVQEKQQTQQPAQQNQQTFLTTAQGNQTLQLQQHLLSTVVRNQVPTQQNVIPLVLGNLRLSFGQPTGNQLPVAAPPSMQAQVTVPAASLSVPVSLSAQARQPAPVKTVTSNVSTPSQQTLVLQQHQQSQNPVLYIPGNNMIYVPPASGQIVCDTSGNKFLVPPSAATNGIIQAVQQLLTPTSQNKPVINPSQNQFVTSPSVRYSFPVQNQTASVATSRADGNDLTPTQTQPNILRNPINTAPQSKIKSSFKTLNQLIQAPPLSTTQAPATNINQTWSQSQSSINVPTCQSGSRTVTGQHTNVKTSSEVVFSGKNFALKPEPDVDHFSNQYSFCSNGIDFVDKGNRMEHVSQAQSTTQNSSHSQYGQRNNQEFISPTQFAPLMTDSTRASMSSAAENQPRTNKRKSRPPVRKDFDEIETGADDGIEDSLDQDFSIFIVPENPNKPPVPFQLSTSTTTEEKRVTIPESMKSSFSGIFQCK